MISDDQRDVHIEQVDATLPAGGHTPSVEGLISLADEPTPSVEGLISLAEELIPSVEGLISLAEEPTPSVEGLISLAEEPITSVEGLISLAEEPITSGEELISLAEELTFSPKDSSSPSPRTEKDLFYGYDSTAGPLSVDTTLAPTTERPPNPNYTQILEMLTEQQLTRCFLGVQSSRATISINSTMDKKPTGEPDTYQFKNIKEPPVEAPYAPLIGTVSILVMVMEVAFVIILDFKAYQAALESIKRHIQSWLRMGNCEHLVENSLGISNQISPIPDISITQVTVDEIPT